MRSLRYGLNEVQGGRGNDSQSLVAIQLAELPREQRGRRGKLNGHERFAAHGALRV